MSIRTAESGNLGLDRNANGGASPAYDGSDSYSLIDRHSNFDGTFHSDRDVRIEGQVKGTIDCQGTLFVAQGANVTAKVEAENITVAGDLNGEIHCRGRLQIMPSGRVHGKVATETLVIDEGAYYEGQLEMTPPDKRGASGSPRPTAPAAVANPVPITPAPSEPRPGRAPQGGSQAAAENGGPASTFIRRFGGPETPWEGSQGEEPGNRNQSRES